jgi:hypothetical protein
MPLLEIYKDNAGEYFVGSFYSRFFIAVFLREVRWFFYQLGEQVWTKLPDRAFMKGTF